MDSGDVLICCTDGITEATDPAGREYGFGRLEGMVRASRDKHSERILEAILDDVDEFTARARQTDDRTLIVVKRGQCGRIKN